MSFYMASKIRFPVGLVSLKMKVISFSEDGININLTYICFYILFGKM